MTRSSSQIRCGYGFLVMLLVSFFFGAMSQRPLVVTAAGLSCAPFAYLGCRFLPDGYIVAAVLYALPVCILLDGDTPLRERLMPVLQFICTYVSGFYGLCYLYGIPTAATKTVEPTGSATIRR